MKSKKTAFPELALSLPEAEQVPHFERSGFKIRGMRMFASFSEEENSANIFLSPAEQKTFCELDPANIYPVPNKWGEKGATTFLVQKVDAATLKTALMSAYQEVLKSRSPKRSSKQ